MNNDSEVPEVAVHYRNAPKTPEERADQAEGRAYRAEVELTRVRRFFRNGIIAYGFFAFGLAAMSHYTSNKACNKQLAAMVLKEKQALADVERERADKRKIIGELERTESQRDVAAAVWLREHGARGKTQDETVTVRFASWPDLPAGTTLDYYWDVPTASWRRPWWAKTTSATAMLSGTMLSIPSKPEVWLPSTANYNTNDLVFVTENKGIVAKIGSAPVAFTTTASKVTRECWMWIAEPVARGRQLCITPEWLPLWSRQ